MALDWLSGITSDPRANDSGTRADRVISETIETDAAEFEALRPLLVGKELLEAEEHFAARKQGLKLLSDFARRVGGNIFGPPEGEDPGAVLRELVTSQQV